MRNILPKDRKHLDFDTWEKEALKDPKLRAEYDRLEPEFAVIQAMIDARIKKDLTQKELAEKLGTTQSAISRLEKGNVSPTVAFLKRLADALDSRLDIRFLR
ncbi:transcriptional regulator [Candidatus Woesebacteria bacterium RIFOXYA1_FULL_40_18]|uniref:Transcriptional regulator n=1 Tax=Candidatus Woesebacteria bacterium RIFOXYA1_FULL_40_18 TaxID=1802532 RepID=A0A1F8CKX8_9BACT|nr:MAG: transcriptional regulator [Candidatus Woesebacteria bacterium RIFOXYA1_FULL_40_18]